MPSRQVPQGVILGTKKMIPLFRTLQGNVTRMGPRSPTTASCPLLSTTWRHSDTLYPQSSHRYRSVSEPETPLFRSLVGKHAFLQVSSPLGTWIVSPHSRSSGGDQHHVDIDGMNAHQPKRPRSSPPPALMFASCCFSRDSISTFYTNTTYPTPPPPRSAYFAVSSSAFFIPSNALFPFFRSQQELLLHFFPPYARKLLRDEPSNIRA